ncbi:hypothetical protein R1sor_015745 [Riccia sorocarpa]|uniref:BTB domain-containing protein n=1 Tax=Riccia sorocarpa TaxID=122646 RepID=A0ABD3HF13_9MARC
MGWRCLSLYSRGLWAVSQMSPTCSPAEREGLTVYLLCLKRPAGGRSWDRFSGVVPLNVAFQPIRLSLDSEISILGGPPSAQQELGGCVLPYSGWIFYFSSNPRALYYTMERGILVDAELLTELEVDYRKMVNREELSDITFVCEDGVRVHACRLMLAARSSFFRGMLLGGMSESRDSNIELPKISSSVLILLLKFLYAGKLIPEDLHPSTSRPLPAVDSYGWERGEYLQLDWSFLVKVIVAARFFMLDRKLEKLIVDKLQSDMEGALFTDDPGEDDIEEDEMILLAKNFSALHEHSDLWAGEGEDNPLKAISSLTANTFIHFHDLDLSTLSHFSEAAFLSYLEETRSSDHRTGVFLQIDEYLRFRLIVSWCVACCRLDNCVEPNRTCIPGLGVALLYLQATRWKTSEYESSLGHFNFSESRADFVNSIPKTRLEPLLKSVDLSLVPRELLCKVIQPLDIIESEEFAEILSAHSVRFPGRLREDMETYVPGVWHVLDETDTWKIPTEDECTFSFIVCRGCSYFTAAAIANLKMHDSERLEWQFTVTAQGSVEQRNMAGFQFGFITLNRGKPLPQEFKGQSPEDVRRYAVQIGKDLQTAKLHLESTVFDWNLGPGNNFQWGTSLKVIVNRNESSTSCSFCYAGDKKTAKFVLAQNKVVYPYIYFPVGCFVDRDDFKPGYDGLTVKIEINGGFHDR